MDIAALIASIDKTRAQIVQELQVRQSAYEAARTVALEQLQAELRTLRARVEGEQTEIGQVTFTRDLTRSTYAALARKVQERNIADATGQTEISLASRATSATLASRPLAQSAALGAAAGVLLGLIVGLLVTRSGRMRSSVAPPAPVLATS
jgi:hypothetical protein